MAKTSKDEEKPDNESRQEELVNGISTNPVDIIGLGMHGSWTAVSLAALGVPSLRLWDGDTVSPANLDTQAYRTSDVGETKSIALSSLLRSKGYEGKITSLAEWSMFLDEPPNPIVICCADDMDIRKDVANWSFIAGHRLFIESRSAGNTLFVHAFKVNHETLPRYLDNYFPEITEEVPCGATGTAAIGMQVASLIAGLLILTKGGEEPDNIRNEHEITLGLSHVSKALA